MRALRFHARATKRTDSRAALDVHKRVLMVVVGKLSDAAEQQLSAFTQRKFGATRSELPHLQAWLQDQGVEEVVLEPTARSWKPGWLALEELFRLRLAQACSNRAPRGRKTGFKDTQRLARRHLAGDDDASAGTACGRICATLIQLRRTPQLQSDPRYPSSS